jgi:hypothetical protein
VPFALHRADGPPLPGPLVYLQKDWSLQVGKKNPARIPGADFISLRRTDTPLPPLPRAEHVVFANGDRLVLDPKGSLRTNGEALECKAFCRANGENGLTLPMSRVALLWLGTPKGTDTSESWQRRLLVGKSPKDLVVLRDGDQIRGNVTALDRAADLKIEAGGRVVRVPFARVAAVAFNGDLLVRTKPKGPYGHLVLANGSRLSVSAATLAVGATTLLAHTELGDTLEIPLVDVTGLDVRQGHAVCLSDLTPLDYQHTPYLGVAWPFARDACVTGRPIFLAGSTFDKGVGMHGASRITYALEGKYRWFEALVGLDGHTGQLGRARVRVLVDDKPRTIGREELGVRAGPMPVRLDVRGARRLTLVVDVVRFGDVQAHVNWADARLIK